MPPVGGSGFLLKIENSGVPGAYRTLGGQKGLTFNRTTTEADATSKDSASWHEGAPMIREASLDAEGFILETDAAYGDLETHWFNNESFNAQLLTPAAHTYTGKVTLTKLNITGPHDNLAGLSVTLKFSGVIVKV